mmetsp:Transcript_13608/g.39250  ORF Transcript_13608/g.39250 Transcript_13608/m.39250 type:complete len:350 (-) Transcript_13608:1332-2381(-)
MPSVSTTTVECTLGRPWSSKICPAMASASPVFVCEGSKVAPLTLPVSVDTSAVSGVSTSTLFANLTAPACAKADLSSASKVMRLSTACTNSCAAAKPSLPMLPEESRAKTTSIMSLHFSSGSSLHFVLLQANICQRSGSCSSGQVASPMGGRTTFLTRDRWPELQALLQADHSVHCDKAQSWSQGCTLQSSSCMVSPVGKPPCCAWRTMSRCRVRVPPPQACEHCDQSCHLPIMPSIGHGFSLHFRFISKGGHLAVFPAENTMRRVNACSPPLPHDFEHSPGTQSETMQSPTNSPSAGDTSLARTFALHIAVCESCSRASHCFVPAPTPCDNCFSCSRCMRRAVSRSLC